MALRQYTLLVKSPSIHDNTDELHCHAHSLSDARFIASTIRDELVESGFGEDTTVTVAK